MFEQMGRAIYRRRRLVLVAAVAFLAFAGIWGTGVFSALSPGGFTDPATDSFRAAQTAADRLGRDDADVIVLYRSASSTVDDPAYQRAVTSTLSALPRDPVAHVTTYSDSRAVQLVSADRHMTYAVLQLTGDEQQREDGLKRIHDRLRAPGLQTEIGGVTAVNSHSSQHIHQD